MKRIQFILGVALLLMGFGLSEAKAQVSVQNVLKRASAVVEKLEDAKSQVVFMQIDNMKKDQIATQTYTLEGGSTYIIVAVGDEDRIQDIDLVVVDDEGNVVGKDNDDKNLALVKVKTKEGGAYKIGVKGYKMSKNDGFYGLIICRMD